MCSYSVAKLSPTLSHQYYSAMTCICVYIVCLRWGFSYFHLHFREIRLDLKKGSRYENTLIQFLAES